MTRSKVSLPPLFDTISVVQVPRPVIDRPTRKLFSLKKAAHSSSSLVALVCIVLRNLLPRPAYCFGQRERRAEKLNPHQRWLATLPGEITSATPRWAAISCARRSRAGRRPSGTGRRDRALFGKEEAVLAVEIAHRAGGLGQE